MKKIARASGKVGILNSLLHTVHNSGQKCHFCRFVDFYVASENAIVISMEEGSIVLGEAGILKQSHILNLGTLAK